MLLPIIPKRYLFEKEDNITKFLRDDREAREAFFTPHDIKQTAQMSTVQSM